MPAAMPLSAVQTEFRRALLEKLASGEYTLESVPRCLCGSVASKSIADRDRFGIPIGVELCNRCGLARTTPRLATRNLAAFYEHDYHGLHLSIRDPDPETVLCGAGQGRAIYAYVSDLLPPGRLHVADIGAGTGPVLRELQVAAGSRQVTGAGCDYSSAFVAAGRIAGTDLRQGGPEQLLELGPFDLVILSHVVEHFPDPVADLAAVRALGHSRTLFYVEVPGLGAIARKPEYAYRLAQYLTLAHTYHFTLATLLETMARAGFGVVRGDEYVRAVFRQAPVIEAPWIDPMTQPQVLESLGALDSLPIRAKRILPVARQRLAAFAKGILPARLMRAVQHARSR